MQRRLSHRTGAVIMSAPLILLSDAGADSPAPFVYPTKSVALHSFRWSAEERHWFNDMLDIPHLTALTCTGDRNSMAKGKGDRPASEQGAQ